MRKLLALALLFVIPACKGGAPFVMTVESDGAVYSAFDLDTLYIRSDGHGQATIAVKGSALPAYAKTFDVGQQYIAHLSDPKFDLSVGMGEPIPLHARPYVESILDQATINRLGIIFSATGSEDEAVEPLLQP